MFVARNTRPRSQGSRPNTPLISTMLVLALAMSALVAPPAFADEGGLTPLATAESNVTRVSGAGRHETAVAASQKAYPSTADAAIVAKDSDYPDALAASALAGVASAPILLTDTGSLNAATATELARLKPSTVYIVGSTAAVSKGVADAIAALPFKPTVTRLGGADRYETARLIAEKAVELGASTSEVFLASGENFPDALSVGSFAASQGIPVLLTNTAALNASAKAFIDKNRPSEVIVPGSIAAVSEAATQAVTNAGATVTRYGGADRYETSFLVVTKLAAKYGLAPYLIGVASGDKFPDALSGAASIGHRGGVLVITPPDSADGLARIIDAIKGDRKPRVEIIGGPAAVGDKVEQDLAVIAPKPSWNEPMLIEFEGGSYIKIEDDLIKLHGWKATSPEEVAQTYIPVSWNWYYSSITGSTLAREDYLSIFEIDFANVDFDQIPDLSQQQATAGTFSKEKLFQLVSGYLRFHGDGRVINASFVPPFFIIE